MERRDALPVRLKDCAVLPQSFLQSRQVDVAQRDT
jgi:hypothetical protein